MKNNQQTEPENKKNFLLSAARIAALLFVIVLTVFIIRMPEEQAEQLESYGYVGIFLISILANATVLIPAPGLVIVFTMGAKFSPFLIGLAAGAGAAIGELSGYLAGFSGQAIIEDQKRYDQMVSWMEKNGALTIMILSFIPNPLFDLAGMVAGISKIPIHKFLFWVLIGKILKMMLFAYAGAGVFSAPWLDRLMGV